MTKTAFLIPGRGEQIRTGYEGCPDRYYNLMDGLNRHGFRIVDVVIDWEGSVYDDWVNAAKHQIIADGANLKESCIAGFSWGSLAALGVSQELVPRVLGLASLSPHGGKGSLERLQQWQIANERPLSSFTDAQYAAFEAINIDVLVDGVKSTRTVIAYGNEENEPLIQRCRYVSGLLPEAIELEVPGAKHDITNPTYARMFSDAIAEQFEQKDPKATAACVA